MDATLPIAQQSSGIIALSTYTQTLLRNLLRIKKKVKPDEMSRITVSQTVSLFAIVYERIRNAVEYREDHLIRRAAIERIIKRRFTLNPQGTNEAENILRELLWARYFANGELGGQDMEQVQKILDAYGKIKRAILGGRPLEEQQFLSDFLMDLLTCEIEETLSPASAQRQSLYSSFIFQVLRRKIKIEAVSENLRDAYLFAALERAYRKNDESYQRYHMFLTFYKPIHTYTSEELHSLQSVLPSSFKKMEDIIKNPLVDKLMRFTRKHLPPFLILFSIINKFGPASVVTLLTRTNDLWIEVESTCRAKYQLLSSRMRTLAIRSFIYIFLTKMLFALILEIPVSNALYGEINNTSIAINTLFPPFLMLLIVSFFKIPGEDNTRNIYTRIIDIINADKSFENSISYIAKSKKVKKPILIFGFTIFYSLTFIVTLTLIYRFLIAIEFNFISSFVFIFFISLVTFFSYRVKQFVNEYRLSEKDGILTPIFDFFFMPILSLGKIFSGGLSRLNFLIFILDFLIEAPFKLIFEVVEEWISFVRKRKEEII